MSCAEKKCLYVQPAPNTEAIADSLGIDTSHYSADFLATLESIVSLSNTRVIACAERLVPVDPVLYDPSTSSYHYEVRLTTEECGTKRSSPSWQHYVLTNSNHMRWRLHRTTISKQNILPASSGCTRFRIYQGALSKVYVRRFALEYIGCLTNLKARFYREIHERERLARMRLPGVAVYLGCVVQDGLVVGVALRRPMYSLDNALSRFDGVPCAEISSNYLVRATIAMQCAGMTLKAPVRPSAVVLDWNRCLVLADIGCLFPEPPGMLFADLLATSQKAPPAVLQSPLGPVFARILQHVVEFERASVTR
ncbi:hypothetical protein EV178_003357 [Coemansia sp. RSA 1646]|nr:hypothetical protein EV178_003357 [Coemansia sp. RSA 1646]